MKNKKEICHVCKKPKTPYTIFLTNDVMSLTEHLLAREDGPICQRCNQYYAMTGDFKDATKEEFNIAKKSAWFARMVLKWWEKDQKLCEDDQLMSPNARDWEGTSDLSSWCRKELTKQSTINNKKVNKDESSK